MGKVTNLTMLQLLLWKNYKLRMSSHTKLAMEILVPMLILGLIIYLRHETTRGETKAPEFKESNKDMSYGGKESYLIYAPDNNILSQIMEEARTRLRLSEASRGFKTYGELETEMVKNKKFKAVIEFAESLADLKEYPKTLSYAIRVPFDLTWNTKERYFKTEDIGFPNNMELPYDTTQFTKIQNAISMAFIKLAKTGPGELPEVKNVDAFPYPAHDSDSFNSTFKWILVALILSCIYSATLTLRRIVLEKERQLKVVMKIMGLNNWLQWLSWFCDYFTIQMIFIIVLVVLFKITVVNLPILPKTDWVVLFIFLLIASLSLICFHFMLSSFFHKVGTASVVQSFVIMGFALIPIIIRGTVKNLDIKIEILMCFLCIPALNIGLDIIVRYECIEKVLNFDTLFTPVTPDEKLTMGLVMCLMVANSIVFMIICLYVEQIAPGEYDFPRPWYFLFTRDFWCKPKLKRVSTSDVESSFQRRNPDAFEAEPVGKVVGVRVINMRKKFGKNEVVRGLNMNMYRDEITVLLGHNGAGKTTSISMIAGMIPPTAGTAIVNGIDIRKDIRKVRKSLGVCPQHNILFDQLSVENHIRFFSRLKGLSGSELNEEIKRYLKILDLQNKSNTRAEKLSGGMKRKLSVCCAMCGGSTVVLCDEPSAGMDPASRRQLWNLLISQKKGRTILLTTHLMDEADILGDRISIMSEGELKCQGTAFFLKKKYGSGYQLVCTKGEGCQVSQVTAILSKHIPNLQPESDIGSEITYILPENYAPVFKNMLSDLEQKADAIRLTGFGMNITTLEDVFMKVGSEQLSQHDQKNQRNTDFAPLKITRKQQNSGPILLLNRIWAMQLKNMLYNYYNITLLVMQLLIPLLIAVSPLIMANMGGGSHEKGIKFDLKQYPDAVCVLEKASDVIPNSIEDVASAQYKNLVTSDGSKFESTDGKTLDTYTLAESKKNIQRVSYQFIIGATITKEAITPWFNRLIYHSAPLALNVVHNAVARAAINADTKIEVSNKPLSSHIKGSTADDHNQHGEDAESLGLKVTGPLSAIVIAITILLTFFILFPIMERTSRTKLLLYISGINACLFWIMHWIWDVFIFSIFLLLTLIIYACVKEGSFSLFSEESHYMLLFFIYGVTLIPLIYLLSYLFEEKTEGFTMFINIFLFLLMGALIITIIEKDCEPLYALHPYGLIKALYKNIFQMSANATICEEINKPVPTEDETDQFDRKEMCAAMPYCCGAAFAFWQFKTPGVLKEVLYMMLVGFICMFIIITYDCGWMDFLKKVNFRCRAPKPRTTKCCCDDDVIRERLKIKNMRESEKRKYNLLTDRLSKTYKGFLAVNKVSFTVAEYECFGLLGVNGAGKTSIFKMLTGEAVISSGNAYVKGISLRKNLSRACQEIGYCPQFDALPEYLTGRLTLRLFCTLHGIPAKHIKKYINDLAESFGFTKHLNKRVGHYSGGNKRKLSAAIAIIGNPSVIYLDEPTAGIDPAARRMLWNNVFRMRNSGKAIVLTSHSMEECEALCTRLSIMISGLLRCLGSIQHLKNKFSKGIVLKIKTDLNAKGYQSTDHKISIIKGFVSIHFANAKLQTEYQGLLTYYLPMDTYSWSQIFGVMEANRGALPMEDYSVSQTTIEEIFLEFSDFDSQPAEGVCSCQQ